MKKLTTEQLAQLRNNKEDFALINVLAPEKFQKEHIPGSANIPLDSDDFLSRVEKTISDKRKKVVVYCASTECNASPTAAEKLEKAGFQEVYDYEGGTRAWKQAGEPTESDS